MIAMALVISFAYPSYWTKVVAQQVEQLLMVDPFAVMKSATSIGQQKADGKSARYDVGRTNAKHLQI